MKRLKIVDSKEPFDLEQILGLEIESFEEGLRPRLELLMGNEERIVKIYWDTRMKILKVLCRYPDFIGSKPASMIASREGELAVEKFIKNRYLGKRNDMYVPVSSPAGLRMLVTVDGFSRAHPQDDYTNFYLGYMRIEDPFKEGSVQCLTLVNCIYDARGQDLEISRVIEDNLMEGTRRAEDLFVLNYQDVIRIEGKGNELWQNPNFSWDGKALVNY